MTSGRAESQSRPGVLDKRADKPIEVLIVTGHSRRYGDDSSRMIKYASGVVFAELISKYEYRMEP